MVSNTPCLGCPDRHVGCHGACEAYQAFRAHKDQENKINLLEKQSTPDSQMAQDLVTRRIKAIKRGRKS